MQCPVCTTELEPKHDNVHILYHCPKCMLAYTSITYLKNNGKKERNLLHLRNKVLSEGKDSHACPNCNKPMTGLKIPEFKGEPKVEVCKMCNYFFMPEDSVSELPNDPLKARNNVPISKSTERKAVNAHRRMDRVKTERYEHFRETERPGTSRHFFFPEMVNPPNISTPAYITYIYALGTLLVSLLVLFKTIPYIRNDYSNVQNVLTSFFVFRNLFHVFYLYFLILMGYYLEAVLGKLVYLILICSGFLINLFLGSTLSNWYATGPDLIIGMIVFTFVFLFPFKEFDTGTIVLFRAWYFRVQAWMMVSFFVVYRVFIRYRFSRSLSIVDQLVWLIVTLSTSFLFVQVLGGRKAILTRKGIEAEDNPAWAPKE